jgi:uncharacterized protein YyaL (SSP411 family)
LRDDKVLTDWNGLMISALVRGYACLGDEKYVIAAQRSAQRVLDHFDRTTRLPHSFLGERVQETQLLLDYAAFANGLLDLFLADGNPHWFAGTTNLVRELDERFASADSMYRMSTEEIGGRSVSEYYDNVLPSGISMAALVMAKLHELTGDNWYREKAERPLRNLADAMQRAPSAFSNAIAAAELLRNPPATVVISGDRDRRLWKQAARRPAQEALTLWVNPALKEIPSSELQRLLSGKLAFDQQPTAYVCRNFVCDLPVHAPADIERLLSAR